MQEDLGVILNPLTKLRLFQVIKLSVFQQMDRKTMIPERADEILEYIKKYLNDIQTPELTKQFYIHLAQKFPELGGVKQHFENQEREKMDHALGLFLEEFMEKGEISLASEILEQIQKANDEKGQVLSLKKRYPIEFSRVMERIEEENFSGY
jgi:DNA-directed RNA polymerase subunit F